MIHMYEPLETQNVMMSEITAEPKELIRIVKGNVTLNVMLGVFHESSLVLLLRLLLLANHTIVAVMFPWLTM